MKNFNGLVKEKYLYVFLIMSIIGYIYEYILEGIINFAKYNSFIAYPHKGVIYGPFNIIYGFGSITIIFLFVNKNIKWYKILIEYSLFLGEFEYLVSFFQELFTGKTSWDYSNTFLNINGRTSVPIMLIWGIFTLIFIKLIFPIISDLIEHIPYRLGTISFYVLLVLMFFNIFITWTSLYRMYKRKEGYKPITVIGMIYDKIYPDTYLNKLFPHLR